MCSRDRDLPVAEEWETQIGEARFKQYSFIVKRKRKALRREGGSESGMPPTPPQQGYARNYNVPESELIGLLYLGS